MENLNFILTMAFFIIVVLLFIRLALRIRKNGGSMTTTVHGSLDAFYNKDKKKAVEMVIEKRSGKKLEEQSSSDDKDKKIDSKT